MKAITITEPGGPEALELSEVPEPVPAEGEVLVDVAAAGLNRADVMQRRGFYPPPPGASEYLGLEVSGRIAEAGHGFRKGQEVVALLAGGGYAERVAVPAGQVIPVPEGVDLVSAAGLPEVAATVYSNVFMIAGLKAGETLLVHGGAGGIGAMAIQLAKALGARVIATAGSAAKCEKILELGADEAVNYREQDFVGAAQRFGGADVILDVMGGSYLARNLEALALGGRLVVIGLQGGSSAELDLAALMGKRASVIGTTLRSRPVDEKAAVMEQVRRVVWPLIAQGTIKPSIGATFPLDQARQAHDYFDSGEHQGKVLLTI
ncbi:NAD(P)H-quinone oxidoreductase [Arthrobacter russicus]|jgi:putative PIG3 family NAD(P)H quinone oxidoreductase|uniref:NADPH2:quinone reductase n=1 Tax=Arthrobacter russicus TaxID=172040 RepID=A0ABU1JBZ6_9MICC|nr:NAD(P)H-quinone oxidoreductase [Arthrobacter russicus]MDR6269930.1 NADPH2:quinone reductase [Arthrobacter russicus]